MRSVTGFFSALLLALIAGCQPVLAPEIAPSEATETSPDQSAANEADHVIYVVSNGWHTAIVLARSDLPNGVMPEVEDFPNASYLEFSWGDARYFPASEKRLGMAMNALFIPTPAMLHLAGLPAHPGNVFPAAETVALRLTPEGFQNLVTYLDDTFDRDSGASGIPGLYRFSRFYPANGRFHLFNTCNTWTARGLATAGIPVTVTGTLEAEELMTQLR